MSTSRSTIERPQQPDYLSFELPLATSLRLRAYMEQTGLTSKSGTVKALLKQRLDEIMPPSRGSVNRKISKKP